MKLVTGIRLIAVAGVVALAMTTAHANLITNPGFEVPTAPATFPITGWALNSVYGTAQLITGSPGGNVHSGDQAALLTVTGPGPFEFVVTRQEGVPVSPGSSYLVSFWLKALPAVDTKASVKVKGNPGALPTFFPTETWAQYSYMTSPLLVNPTEVQFEFSGPLGTRFYFDDVSMTVVPEPTTIVTGLLLLLPFGASALRILRRNFAFAGDSLKSQKRLNMSRQWGDNESD